MVELEICVLSLSKVSELTRTSESMAAMHASTHGKAVAADEDEEAVGAWLSKAMDEQNRKVDKQISEMFSAIRMISEKVDRVATVGAQTMQKPSNSSASEHDHGVLPMDFPRRARSGTQQPYSGVTRLAKLDFPRFNGERVNEWLFKAEQFFSLDYTPEDLKVKISSIHFEGAAATWHQNLFESEYGDALMHDWLSYKRVLKDRFEEILDDPIAELKNLHETGGIMDYHEKFELIRLRVKLPEEYLVKAYLAGLKTETQMPIRMFQPHSIKQCLMLGRLYEQAHSKKIVGNSMSVMHGSTWSNSGHSSKGILSARPETYQKPSPLMSNDKPRALLTQPRQMSKEEMDKQRALGLCYFVMRSIHQSIISHIRRQGCL